MNEELSKRLASDPRWAYEQLWLGHEPNGFVEWLPNTIGLPSEFDGELGEMPSYWLERRNALNGWIACLNQDKSWAEALKAHGYYERLARLERGCT